MKIITICGSLKFQKEIMVVAERLALLGNCVFTPVYHVIDNINITEEQLLNLKKVHLKKIELSNAVVIIDIDNYIGDSTSFYGNNSAIVVKDGATSVIKNITLTLDETSSIKLTGDCYINELDNKDTSNSKIDFNGYKLYVNGSSIN